MATARVNENLRPQAKLMVHQELAQKIASRQAKIGVIGMGYVGLPLSLLFSSENFCVTGFDVDQKKVERLLAGRSYIAQLHDSEIKDAKTTGFVATTKFARIEEMD